MRASCTKAHEQSTHLENAPPPPPIVMPGLGGCNIFGSAVLILALTSTQHYALLAAYSAIAKPPADLCFTCSILYNRKTSGRFQEF